MHSLSRSISHLTLALVVAVALRSTGMAQEVGSVDLTKIQAPIDFRRPTADSPQQGGYIDFDQYSCSQAPEGALRASLVSLDRTHYRAGEASKFEVTVENTGSGPITIPLSPHLADLQPKDPAQKFSYLELQIGSWIAGRHWKADTGPIAVLYGADDHPDTILSLHPGQWARIIGEAQFAPSGALLKNMRSHPADRVYTEAALSRLETLVTPTQLSTVQREVCIAHTPGQSVPIQLTVP